MEEIYVNVDCAKPVVQIHATNHRGSSSLQRRPQLGVIVSLGILVVLLLVGLMVLGLRSHHLADLAADLSIIKDNLTERLQTNNDELSSMTEQRDLLKTNLTEMTEELLRLQSSFKKKKTCLVGWKTLNGVCYFLSTNPGSWDAGREDCRSRGADLVVIENEDEQMYLSCLTEKQTWIGLTDKDTEGSWKWVDGTPLGFTHWTKNQPDDGGGPQVSEDCAHIRTDDFWNDLPCTSSLLWICEKAAA